MNPTRANAADTAALSVRPMSPEVAEAAALARTFCPVFPVATPVHEAEGNAVDETVEEDGVAGLVTAETDEVAETTDDAVEELAGARVEDKEVAAVDATVNGEDKGEDEGKGDVESRAEEEMPAADELKKDEEEEEEDDDDEGPEGDRFPRQPSKPMLASNPPPLVAVISVGGDMNGVMLVELLRNESPVKEKTSTKPSRSTTLSMYTVVPPCTVTGVSRGNHNSVYCPNRTLPDTVVCSAWAMRLKVLAVDPATYSAGRRVQEPDAGVSGWMRSITL
jgi:hypothetical protein